MNDTSANSRIEAIITTYRGSMLYAIRPSKCKPAAHQILNTLASLGNSVTHSHSLRKRFIFPCDGKIRSSKYVLSNDRRIIRYCGGIGPYIHIRFVGILHGSEIVFRLRDVFTTSV